MRVLKKPRFIDLTITGACNLTCPYCYASAGRPWREEIPYEALEPVLDEINALKMENIAIDGGEPFLQEDLYAILMRLRPSIRNTVIITNGTLVDDGWVRRLKDTGIRKISVSLDGATEKTHDRTRRGTFALIMRNVERLLSEGFWVAFSTVILKGNYREIVAMYELSRRMGVRVLNLEAFEPFGRGESHREMLMDGDDWRAFLEEVLPYTRENREKIRTEILLPGFVRALVPPHLRGAFARKGCSAGMDHLGILPDGSVVPCPDLIAFPGHVVGHVREGSLMEIWNGSPRLGAFRAKRAGERCSLKVGGYLVYENR